MIRGASPRCGRINAEPCLEGLMNVVLIQWKVPLILREPPLDHEVKTMQSRINVLCGADRRVVPCNVEGPRNGQLIHAEIPRKIDRSGDLVLVVLEGEELPVNDRCVNP